MQPHQSPSNRPGGFSIIELMMVVIVLSLAATLIVAQASSSSSIQAQAAARMLAADIAYAQNEAITTQVPVTVTFDLDGKSYRLTNASGDLKHPITKAGQYVTSFVSQPGLDRVNIVSADFGGSPEVTFDAMGCPSNQGSVTLQAGPHIYRVDVAAATGRVIVALAGP